MLNLDLSGLLAQNFVNRKLRAYAYLTASLNAPQNPASDVVDCLLPFAAAGIADQAKQLLDMDRLRNYLHVLGLRIPLYALEQLLPRLQNMGLIEWNSTARCHICKGELQSTQVVTSGGEASLEDAFATFEDEFAAYAFDLGLSAPPLSLNWCDALIAFLRSDSASQTVRAVPFRETLIGDVVGLETYLVARFIQEARNNNERMFNAVIQIYTGVLIEDFINNIQEIGDARKYNQVSVYYDTTVLLRILGTSGRILCAATMEMHRALEDLGCRCHYLGYTADELSRILETILSNHVAGNEIYGETGEAIQNSEVSIGSIKDISATFEQRLAERHILPADYNYSSRRSEDVYQIDEDSLVAAIKSEALKRNGQYKDSSAQTDARSVAIIMRLRKGVARRSIQACSHLFVSHNAVFQTAARNFVKLDVEGYDGGQIPPVLTLGQITMVAWLATAKKLDSVKVTKELLATCYNAVRPSAAWTQQFSLALKSFRTENPGFVEDRADAALFLQLARNSARDDSLNQPAVLRKVNLAAIFADAAAKADEKERVREAEVARIRDDFEASNRQRDQEELARQTQLARDTDEHISRAAKEAKEQRHQDALNFEREKQEAIKHVEAETSLKVSTQIQEAASRHRSKQSAKIAQVAVGTLRLCLSGSLAALSFLFEIDYWNSATLARILVAAALAAFFLLTILDFLGSSFAKRSVRSAYTFVDAGAYRLLTKLDPQTIIEHERVEPTMGWNHDDVRGA